MDPLALIGAIGLVTFLFWMAAEAGGSSTCDVCQQRLERNKKGPKS
jgi:hypothetical protein